jgi:hypothetical protein
MENCIMCLESIEDEEKLHFHRIGFHPVEYVDSPEYVNYHQANPDEYQPTAESAANFDVAQFLRDAGFDGIGFINLDCFQSEFHLDDSDISSSDVEIVMDNYNEDLDTKGSVLEEEQHEEIGILVPRFNFF